VEEILIQFSTTYIWIFAELNSFNILAKVLIRRDRYN
jgi:hypothetical protein